MFRLLTLVVASLLQTSAAQARARELVVLFTNDIHSQLAPARRMGDDGSVDERGGVARLATLLARERALHPDQTVLVDAGDFSMGTLFHTAFATHAFEVEHLGRLGFDAVTFGNHDFDFLPSGLAACLRAAKQNGSLPGFVASNIVFPKGDDPGSRALEDAFREAGVVPYRVLERGGVRVGVFGLMGRDAAGDAPFARPITFADPVAAARRLVKTLREQEQVDLVLVASHAGTKAAPGVSEDELLAREVAGIDVIVSGHTHGALEAPLRVGQTMIVRAGASLENLGVLRLRLGTAAVELIEHELVPIDSRVSEDPDVARRVASQRQTIEADYLRRHGRRWDEPIAAFPFAPEVLGAHAQPGALALGDLVTDAYAWAVRRAEGQTSRPVDVVIHPRGHLRAGFLPGTVTTADVFRVLSLGIGSDGQPGYPLVSFFVTGAELRDMLEVEATVAPKKRTAHLQISGARFSYNPYRLPADRVTEVSVRDARGRLVPIALERRYRVAMNYYVASRLDVMQSASRGLLSAVPRDAANAPIRDLRAARIDADPERAGVQELKEWVALASYLRSFSDGDGDGVADVPRRYARPAGRIVRAPSWRPSALLGGGLGLTRYALLTLVGCLLLLTALAWRASTRKHRR